MKDLSEVKPGDIVRMVAAPDCRMQVLETATQTCPGGTQYHVAGRLISDRAVLNDLLRLNVIEIELIPADDFTPLLDLIRTAQIRAVAAQRFPVADLLRQAGKLLSQPPEPPGPLTPVRGGDHGA